MTLTGNENHDITLAEAEAWTANYRATIAPGETLGNYIGKDAITAILNQEGCVGLRVYYALDGDNKRQLIFCGVNSDGNDLYNGLLAERTLKNPPNSVAANPLNS